jgi:hypothetical protein
MQRQVFCFGDPPLRKHLSHLRRLRDHLVDLNPPPLPEREGDSNAKQLVETFFEFVTKDLPSERASDVEVRKSW